MRLPDSFATTARAPLAALAALMAAAAWPAHALQVVEGRDGVAVEAILSIKEPTRIRIEGAPITDVFGNIYSSNCGGTSSPAAGGASLAGGTTPITSSSPTVNPAGEVVLECDRDKGEVYVRPVGDSNKPINLFISSAYATYTLVLRRSDVPADTIVIRDPSARAASAPTPLGPAGAAPGHIRTLKAMLLAMAGGRVASDVRTEEVGQPIQLWAGTKLMLVRRFESRGLIGELYQLQNAGPAVMVLAEHEFDRESDDVAGVAIENHNLRPGEATAVYVIRRGSMR